MAGGVLLVVAGVWLLLQTLAGDLPRRLLSHGGAVARDASAAAGRDASGAPGGDGQSGAPNLQPAKPPPGWQYFRPFRPPGGVPAPQVAPPHVPIPPTDPQRPWA